MTFINWSLAKQPMNWLVILFMLLIGAMAGHLMLSYLGVEPTTAATAASNGTGGTDSAESPDKDVSYRNINQ